MSISIEPLFTGTKLIETGGRFLPTFHLQLTIIIDAGTIIGNFTWFAIWPRPLSHLLKLIQGASVTSQSLKQLESKIECANAGERAKKVLVVTVNVIPQSLSNGRRVEISARHHSEYTQTNIIISSDVAPDKLPTT